MGRLKRFAIGTGVTLVALAGLTALWYRGHYILPPESEHKIPLPSPNGFDTLQTAIGLNVMDKNGISVRPRALSYNPIRYPEQPLSGRLELVKANAASFAKIREALTQTYLTPPGRYISKLGKSMRDQARLLVFAGDAYSDANNLPEAARYYTDCIEMGVAIPHGGNSMPFLSGYACEQMGARALDRLADQLDAPTALNIAVRLEKIAQERTPFPEVLQEQNRELHQEMRTLFTGSPVSAWKHIGQEYNGMLGFTNFIQDIQGQKEVPQPSFQDRVLMTGLQTLVTYQGPGPTIAELDRWMTQLEAQSRLSWGPQRPLLQEPAGGLQGNLIAQLIGPIFGQMECKDREARMYLALLQTKLRLRAAFLQTGRYPATLEALPIDPFSPANSPLKYRTDGKTYTLWSVGPDAKDDNGTSVPSTSKDKKRKPSINITSKGDVLA